MLSDTDLDEIRSEVADWFDQWCDILERTEVSDGGGNTTHTWAVTERVRARVSPQAPLRSGTTTEYADRVADIGLWTVTLPYDAPVTERSRLSVAGHVFIVMQVDASRSLAGSVRCHCQEVR